MPIIVVFSMQIQIYDEFLFNAGLGVICMHIESIVIPFSLCTVIIGLYKMAIAAYVTLQCFVGHAYLRDKLKESLVVTKTFQVDEAGLPSDTLDGNYTDNDWLDTNRTENDFRPTKSVLRPQTSSLMPKVELRYRLLLPSC
jgi:hypothetical protein